MVGMAVRDEDGEDLLRLCPCRLELRKYGGAAGVQPGVDQDGAVWRAYDPRVRTAGLDPDNPSIDLDPRV